MTERVLFDVNVLLDVIENRQPHVARSGPALQLAANRQIHGFIAASTIDTLAFLIRKNATSAQTYAVLEDLLQILAVAPVTSEIIHTAIRSRWSDPEDAIIYHTALAANCNCLVTRNERDFQISNDSIRIISPEKLISGRI